MIAGLEAPDEGSIELDDTDITQLSPGDRKLAMVFQSYALFPHLKVKENILFGLQARKVPKDEQKRRLDSVVELVGLGGHLHKKPGQLSGGQCQRVALARAIVAQAKLCLMDEPLSNLDAKLRNEMRTEIRALQQRLGMSVIYVTHDQVEAMSMADRIWQRDEAGEEFNDGVEHPQTVLQRGVDVLVKLEAQYQGQVILLISQGDMLQILSTLFTGISPNKHRSLTHHQPAEIRYLVSQDQ